MLPTLMISMVMMEGIRQGRVTRQILVQRVAPSISAASYRVGSMFIMAAM